MVCATSPSYIINSNDTVTIGCVFIQQRHRSDNEVNNRTSLVLRDGQLVEARWRTVVVGDIIKMENNQFVAVIYFRRPFIFCLISNQKVKKFVYIDLKTRLI